MNTKPRLNMLDYAKCCQLFKVAGISNYQQEARWLVENTHPKQLYSNLKKRLSGMPLAYVLGHQDFYGYRFTVNKHCLIPRQETETLVEKTIAHLKQVNFHGSINLLDLCTGTGCIPIALALELKKLNMTISQITMIDISQGALKVAEQNIKIFNLNNITKIIKSDITKSNLEDYLSRPNTILTTNPPYINPNEMQALPVEVQQEPILALYGGEDGLRFYKSIIKNLSQITNKNNLLFCALEIGYSQKNNVSQIAKQFNFSCSFYKDLAGLDRVGILTF